MRTWNFEKLPEKRAFAGDYIRQGIWVRPGELELAKRKLIQHMRRIEAGVKIRLAPLEFDTYPAGHQAIPEADRNPPTLAPCVYLAVSALVVESTPVVGGTIGLDDKWRDLDQDSKDRLMNVVRAAFKKKWPKAGQPSDWWVELTAARIYVDKCDIITAMEVAEKLKGETPS